MYRIYGNHILFRHTLDDATAHKKQKMISKASAVGNSRREPADRRLTSTVATCRDVFFFMIIFLPWVKQTQDVRTSWCHRHCSHRWTASLREVELGLLNGRTQWCRFQANVLCQQLPMASVFCMEPTTTLSSPLTFIWVLFLPFIWKL